MTPDAYLTVVVLPTAHEFLAARGDRRLAYLSCISAYHLCDYVRRADGLGLPEIRTAIRRGCEAAFDIVEGVCNGSKHCGRDGRGAFDHMPGGERDVAGFGYGMGGGWGQGRWGGVPGLEVEHDGQRLFVDLCLIEFLRAAANAYPAHLAAAAQL